MDPFIYFTFSSFISKAKVGSFTSRSPVKIILRQGHNIVTCGSQTHTEVIAWVTVMFTVYPQYKIKYKQHVARNIYLFDMRFDVN